MELAVARQEFRLADGEGRRNNGDVKDKNGDNW
jgi:hypothetical protein